MESQSPASGKATPRLYLPKRSTVLVHCFLLVTLLAIQYSAVDGVMESLVSSEDEELAYIKQDQYLLEFAVHIGYIFTPALTSVFLVKTANAKIPIILGVIIASLATFFAPGAIQTSLFRGMWARIVFGAGFGMTLVSLFQLIAVWIPRDEYSRSITFIASGFYAGISFGDLWSAILVKSQGWTTVFHTFALVTLVYLAIWSYIVTRSPQSHSKITISELSYLQTNAARIEPSALNLWSLLRLKVTWVFVFTLTVFFVIHTGLVSTIPYLFMELLWLDLTFAFLTLLILLSNTFALCFDYVCRTEPGKAPKKLREVIGTTSFIGTACFLKFFCGSQHALTARIMGYSFAWLIFTNSYCGNIAALLDVFPRHSALILGLTFIPVGFWNIFAHVGLRWILDTTGNWDFVLSLASGLLFFAGVVWGVFGTTERVTM